jgi:hypothetical protein
MYLWTWRDAAGAFLSALDVERRVMFIILSLVVLIAALNIISGLVMLVKNKGRDIGILRTMGLTQGSIMRVFFLCGALIGVTGTVLGVILGRDLRAQHRGDPGHRRVGLRRIRVGSGDPVSHRDPRADPRWRRGRGHGDGAGPELPHHALAGAVGGTAQPGRGAQV